MILIIKSFSDISLNLNKQKVVVSVVLNAIPVNELFV